MMDLQGYSLAQLEDLRKQIDSQIAKTRQEEKQKLILEIKERALAAGMSVEEILAGVKQTASNKPAGVVRYRNPKNPEQQWTGRGRKPQWVVEHLEAGGQIEELSI